MANWMNKRPPKGFHYVPTNAEHIANIFTHGVSFPNYMMIMLPFKRIAMKQFFFLADHDTDGSFG